MLFDLFLSFVSFLLLCILAALVVVAVDVRLKGSLEEKADVAMFALIVELWSNFQIH